MIPSCDWHGWNFVSLDHYLSSIWEIALICTSHWFVFCQYILPSSYYRHCVIVFIIARRGIQNEKFVSCSQDPQTFPFHRLWSGSNEFHVLLFQKCKSNSIQLARESCVRVRWFSKQIAANLVVVETGFWLHFKADASSIWFNEISNRLSHNDCSLFCGLFDWWFYVFENQYLLQRAHTHRDLFNLFDQLSFWKQVSVDGYINLQHRTELISKIKINDHCFRYSVGFSPRLNWHRWFAY